MVCAASNLLFIRQDDIGLFRELRKLQRTLLIGNAGIGKSWFQWIHILFCARPDIYKAISEDDDFPPDRNENKEPPQIILRYTPTKLNVFFPSLGVVHLIPSSAPNYPSLLMEMFDEPRVTLLYDPEVELRSLKIPSLRELNFLVSLSPSVQRFETWKTKIYGGDVLMRYMPCPSLKELIVTVRSINGMSNSGLVGDELKRRNDVDELVKSRVSQIGPFLREVIQRDEVWNKTLKDRLKMFGKLDLSMLGETVPDHPENHFIHIYAVDREDLPYSKFTLKLSCDLVVEEAKKALAKLGC
ncbi:hypothetical protein BASA81_001843 [Batrachochytrium salamandrivorans]|nr:hypothetical protein BASA81_009303 [Batrachochytrium salamandrivorans]KAH9260071.1 hypothetical protein BASA81_001843 [Batrachochytrium salamandrivorans]